MNDLAVLPNWRAESDALDALFDARSVPIAVQRIRPLAADSVQEWHELLARPVGVDVGRTIALAEQLGCVSDVDVIVASHALRLARSVSGRVSLNVSGQSVSDRRFLARLVRAVESSGFPFGRLVIEITETAPVTDFRAAGSFAEWIREQGAWIVLDDVSDAMTSVPLDLVDGVKVDREIVAAGARGGEARSLLRAIVAMAKGAGIVCVAEGVEQPQHLSMVSALGFTHYQGFLHDLPIGLG